MHKAEYLSVLGQICQSIEAALVMMHVLVCFFGINGEDKDEHLYILENVFSL